MDLGGCNFARFGNPHKIIVFSGTAVIEGIDLDAVVRFRSRQPYKIVLIGQRACSAFLNS